MLIVADSSALIALAVRAAFRRDQNQNFGKITSV